MQILYKQLFILLLLYFSTFSLLQAVQKTHFTIAIDPEYIPFTQRDIDGEATGLLVDFWNLWAKENGFVVEYKFYPWEETLLATQRGEVDFHSGTTKERAWMFASDPIYELVTALFTLQTFSVNSTRDIVNKRIGTIDPYYGELVREVLGGNVEIVTYDDYPLMVEALKSKKIDALIDDVEAIRYFLIKTGQMNKIKRVELKELQFINKIYAITNSDNIPVLEQINEGLKNLDLIDLVNIEEVWLPKIDDAYYNKQLSEKIKYTPKEQVWMKRQKELTVTGDPSWKLHKDSFNYEQYRGVSGDYMSIFSKKTGLDFRINPIESWAEILATPEEESADIVLGMMNDNIKKLLEEKYTFLKSYQVGSLVIIMDRNIRFVTDLCDVKDKRIGMLDLQNYTNPIEYHYESYTFIYHTKINKLMDALLDKQVDAVILPLPEAILALADSRYESLDIIGKMEKQTYVNIGVLKSKPQLEHILQKVIQSIGRYDKKKILAKWTQKLNYIEKVDYRLTFMIAGFLSFLLLSTIYYVYFLRRKNEHEKKLSMSLEALALEDDLTGLMNKRAFNQSFEHQFYTKGMVGLLFIDIDYFKKYNDYYGHLAGDKTLKKVADILNTFQSENAFAYRIGGEEFGYILYDSNQQKTVAFAQTICDKIADAHIEHKESQFGIVTVSIGISIGEQDTTNRQNFYDLADRALYTAKALGRNQIYFIMKK